VNILESKVVPFLYITTSTGLFRVKLVDNFYIECFKYSEWDRVHIGIDLSKQEYEQLSEYAETYT